MFVYLLVCLLAYSLAHQLACLLHYMTHTRIITVPMACNILWPVTTALNVKAEFTKPEPKA